LRGVHQIHDETKSILVPAPEIAPETFASESQHPAADHFLCLAGYAFNVIPDDPGAAAGKDDYKVRVILCIGLLYGLQKFSFAAIDDIAFIENSACCGLERNSTGLAAFPCPDKVGHIERASSRAMDKGDDMLDATDDII
jgi:hypothetical protein